MASGTTQNLDHVWGSGADDVWAVGSSGLTRHFNGASWSGMTSGATELLWDAWGSGPDDVIVVGEQGTILHYGGSPYAVYLPLVIRSYAPY